MPILTGGAVALAGADGVLDPARAGSSPRMVALDGETPAQAMARMQDRAAHGLRLRKLLGGAAGRSLTGTVPVTTAIERRADAGDCGTVAAPTPHDPAQGVAPCDQLWLTLTNTGGKAQDVTVLYFSADFLVRPIWPVRNPVNRLAPGESCRVSLMIEPGSTPGLEEIWVLAVPVDPDAPRVDLTHLAAPGATRDLAGADALTLWLEDRLEPDNRNRTPGRGRALPVAG